ncbi:MAG: LuxR C-terminal-related transcriptional regulator [Anaerolineae bacterium]
MVTGTDTAVQHDALQSLLLTKLQRPPLPPDNVARPRIVAPLRRVLDYPLTLVSAPGGYGKSTAVAQALAEVAAPSVWLTVDEYDNELGAFLDYLIAGLQTQFPGGCPQTQRLLEAIQMPPVEAIAACFANELQAVAPPFVLVLDDVHHLTDAAIGQFFALLLRGLPTSLHLVVITQSDPPWPVARLAERGQMLEIRGDDLRFRLDEAMAFLEAATGASLPADMVAFLVQHTEGWGVALRLAALNLTREPGRPVSVSALRPSADSFAPRALVGGVLARQSPAVRDFLLRTSILDHMNPELCAALLAPPPPTETAATAIHTIRAWLRQTNLFIVPLDETGEWYRYHHLFQDLLRRELASRWDAESIRELHRRASAWLDAHGFPDEAMRHALAAGDTDRAADIIEKQVHARLNREDWRGVEHSLSLLPPDLRDQRPGLLLAQTWVMGMQEKGAAVMLLLQAAEAVVADPTARVSEADRVAARGQIAAMRSYSLFWRTQTMADVLALARTALADLPRDYQYAHSVAYYVEGLGMHIAGCTTDAIASLQRVAESPNAPAAVKARCRLSLATIYRAAGPLLALEQSVALHLKLALENNFATSEMWAHHFLGSLHYERNELEQAAAQFEIVAEQHYLAHAECVRGTLIELALTYQAQGRAREADAAARKLVQVSLEFSGDRLAAAHSLEVRLAVARHDTDAALRGAAQLDGILPSGPMIVTEIPAITRAQALLVGSGNERQQALALLDTLEAMAEATHVWRPLVRILALQAVGLAAEKRDTEALAKLERAVSLAEPMGLIRTFVDVGPSLAPLVQRLLESGVAQAYLRQVLAGFAGEIQAAPSARLVKDGALSEPLTDREMEILRLLGRGLSNKEIGAQLVIAPETAKRHTGNIYGKLGVHSRREAVLRAQALGLLPPR